MIDLSTMTVKQLKDTARDMHISNWWNMKKAKLIEKINEANALIEEDPEEAKQQAWENEKAENENADLKEFSDNWDEKHPREELPEKPKKSFKAKPNIEGIVPKRGAKIEYNGKSQNLSAWSKELGISPKTLYGRIYILGWAVDKAFSKKGRNNEK